MNEHPPPCRACGHLWRNHYLKSFVPGEGAHCTECDSEGDHCKAYRA